MGLRGPKKEITKNSTAITVYIPDTHLVEIEKVRRIREMTRPAIVRQAIAEFLDRFWKSREAK